MNKSVPRFSTHCPHELGQTALVICSVLSQTPAHPPQCSVWTLEQVARLLKPGEPLCAGEPGEWTHGWQFWASSISDTRRALLSNRTAARQAHLRSHSGRNAGQPWRSPPQPRNSPSLLICSVFWCWNACICPFPSLRQFVKVAVPLWTFTATTERRT